MKAQIAELINCELFIFCKTEEEKATVANILHDNSESSTVDIKELLDKAGISYAEEKAFIIGARPKGIPTR